MGPCRSVSSDSLVKAAYSWKAIDIIVAACRFSLKDFQYLFIDSMSQNDHEAQLFCEVGDRSLVWSSGPL